MKLQSLLTPSFMAAYLAAATLSAQASSFYAGVAISNNQFVADGPGDNTVFEKGQEFKDSDSGYRVDLGYQFTNYLSAEVAYNDYGTATDQFNIKKGIFFIVSPNTIQDLSAKSAVLSLRATYPLNDHVAIFGSLGIANTRIENVFRGGFSEQVGKLRDKTSSTEQGLEFGAGLTVSVHKNVDLRWDIKRTDAGDLTLNQLSAGLDFHF